MISVADLFSFFSDKIMKILDGFGLTSHNDLVQLPFDPPSIDTFWRYLKMKFGN